MNAATIIAMLKAILPTKKIAAWILGVLGAALAIFMGVTNSDLKAQYCASEVVNLPKLEVVAPMPEAAPAPAVKK